VNLRFPLVAGIVIVAGAAAALRAMRPSPASPPPVAAAFESPAPESTSPQRHRRGARADRAGAGLGERVVVYVAGEVLRRGVYTLPASARAGDALTRAGGPAPDADLVAVNLAAPLTDGEEIAVPPKGAVFSTPRAERRTPGGSRRRSGKLLRRARHSTDGLGSEDGPAQLVDLNRADENELETLPGIGPALAARIVEFREANGPFGSLDDLLDVGGMSQRKLDDLEPYATLH
jgi:competence protein ComEA